MPRLVCTALLVGTAFALSKVELLTSFAKVSKDDRIHAPVLNVSAIVPGVRQPGLKAYSTVLMHGLGDAGKNPGMHSLAVVRKDVK